MNVMAQLVGVGVIRTDDERLDDAEPLPYSGLGLVVLARPEPIGSRNCGSASELTAGTASHFLGFRLLDILKSLDHCINWIQCSLARVTEWSDMRMQIIVLCSMLSTACCIRCPGDNLALLVLQRPWPRKYIMIPLISSQ